MGIKTVVVVVQALSVMTKTDKNSAYVLQTLDSSFTLAAEEIIIKHKDKNITLSNLLDVWSTCTC